MTDHGMLEIEPGARVSEHECPDCGEYFQRVTGLVYRNGDAHAVYYASCYHHNGHEAFIDAIFSPTWDDDTDDHVTFGCRVGPIDGQRDPACSLVKGGAAFSDTRMLGNKLSRDEALQHPLVGTFWALVDHILVNDQVVRNHIYGPDAVLEGEPTF